MSSPQMGRRGYNNCHAARKEVLFTTEVQASQLIASGSKGHAAVVVTLL